jgi:hypothetical protein
MRAWLLAATLAGHPDSGMSLDNLDTAVQALFEQTRDVAARTGLSAVPPRLPVTRPRRYSASLGGSRK